MSAPGRLPKYERLSRTTAELHIAAIVGVNLTGSEGSIARLRCLGQRSSAALDPGLRLPGYAARWMRALIRSTAATSSRVTPGSRTEWPASATTTSSAPGQARASVSALTIGQTMS